MTENNISSLINNPKYSGLDNYKQPKSDYLNKLANMDDNQLEVECGQMIWLSAYANNNPRSDYHWQCNACYDECMVRNKENIYKRAYNKNISKY